MKTETWLIIGVLAYLVFSRGKQIASELADKIGLTGGSVKVKDIGQSGVLLGVTLLVRNQSGISIPLDRFQGAIYYSGQKLGDVDLARGVTIRPQDVTQVKLDSYINYGEMTSSLASIFQAGQFLPQVQIKGELCYGRACIPINTTVSAV